VGKLREWVGGKEENERGEKEREEGGGRE